MRPIDGPLTSIVIVSEYIKQPKQICFSKKSASNKNEK